MKFVLAFLSLLNTISIFAQPTIEGHYPGVHDYLYVEKEPKLLNYEEIRREIGYPSKAVKETHRRQGVLPFVGKC